jgi:hypothetical protein
MTLLRRAERTGTRAPVTYFVLPFVGITMDPIARAR